MTTFRFIGWNMGGAVAPTPAPALSAGPVPYPVMLGSDPGVLSFYSANISM